MQLGVAGKEEPFDYVVLALPFDGLASILPNTSAAQPLRDSLARFETSPITGIHLWFDREISDLEHAVLLDRTIQWMFHKSKLQKRENNGHGSYVELVVSSSKSLVDKSKQEIVDLAVEELREFFPAARQANLVKSTVIKEIHATYSPTPGIDLNRPHPETVWPRVFLAGDWTATGWPATMEGAVRSGYLGGAVGSSRRGQARCHVPGPGSAADRLYEIVWMIVTVSRQQVTAAKGNEVQTTYQSSVGRQKHSRPESCLLSSGHWT